MTHNGHNGERTGAKERFEVGGWAGICLGKIDELDCGGGTDREGDGMD